ncbi:hypothetical protein D3C85_1358680 [compost metagenome]
MVSVEAVFVELVQVNVVQARAAVNHAIIDHETLQMQHAEQFARLHRHAIHRYFTGVGTGRFLIPRRIARLLAGTNQAALSAQPVNHHDHIQFRTRQFGGVQGIENFLTGFILLQVQRNDIDAVRGLGDLLQQATTKLGGAGKDGDGIGGQRKTAQFGQQIAFEKRRHRTRSGSNLKNS